MKKPLDSKHRGGIDLHIHSTASDGTCTPAELIMMASDSGLEAIAITDHDTLEGIRELQRLGIPDRLHMLTGVEISTRAPEGFHQGGSLHILGYGVDTDHAPLQEALTRLQTARETRIPQILERLNGLGIPITMTHILTQTGRRSVGRPHVGAALVKIGVVTDMDQAFDRFLSKGRPAYVDKYRMPCKQAVELIHDAGGVAVLAHPYLVPGGGRADSFSSLLDALCDLGLDGIEVYYPQHPPEAEASYLQMARQFGLLVTGGTDFHGDLSPEIQMGRGRGDMHIPYALYEALAARVGPAERRGGDGSSP